MLPETYEMEDSGGTGPVFGGAVLNKIVARRCLLSKCGARGLRIPMSQEVLHVLEKNDRT